MSEYKVVQCEFTVNNEQALVDALKEVFTDSGVIVHDQAAHLYGYQGDRRAQKAHIVIPRNYVGPGANDLGFERLANGRYRYHVSEFDRSKWGPAFVAKLSGSYGVRVQTRVMQKKGYRLQSTEKVGTKQRFVWVKT